MSKSNVIEGEFRRISEEDREPSSTDGKTERDPQAGKTGRESAKINNDIKRRTIRNKMLLRAAGVLLGAVAGAVAGAIVDSLDKRQ